MITKTYIMHSSILQLVTSTTFIFSPFTLQAMYWQTLAKEKSASPIGCVLKCEELQCPGVAFQRDQNICLFGSFQSIPINDDENFVEIWKIRPLIEYGTPSSSSSKHLAKNDCTLFSTWVKQENGKLYKVNSQVLSKQEQETYCKGQGGLLAMIKTKEEEDIITNLVGNNQTWIGITNFNNEVCLNESCEGHLVWSDGTMFVYDANTYSKDFNSGSGHPCSRIKGQEYNDNDCSSLFAGICETMCD